MAGRWRIAISACRWSKRRKTSLNSSLLRLSSRWWLCRLLGIQVLSRSDYVGMHALAGSFGERTRGLLAAGCDMVLHCSGVMDEMRAIARETPDLSGTPPARA